MYRSLKNAEHFKRPWCVYFPISTALSEIATEQDSDIVCQAGVTWDGINRYLDEHGIPLFLPVCPRNHEQQPLPTVFLA